jgi:phage tail sheath gpL-like
MSEFGPNSKAAGVGVGVDNVNFQSAAQVLQRRIGIIGTYDPLKTTIVDEVPALALNAADVGDRYGFGFQLHALAKEVFKGAPGAEVYVIPQAEVGTQAAGDVTFTASTVEAGTVPMYLGNEPVFFDIIESETSDDVATKAVAAIVAKLNDLMVTAVVGTPTNKIDLTAKSKGLFGNFISIAFARKPGESLPNGLSVVITNMATGTGTPDIADALNGLGVGDNANEIFITDLVHGYGIDATTVLDPILTYVGAGDNFVALYGKTVARPFRSLVGDVVAGSSGLSALVALGALRKTDRANGIISVPGSTSHPALIAAQALGHMARINNIRAEENYAGIVLIDIDPGDTADRWTSDYDDRDIAVKAGISPTLVDSGLVKMQNVVSFYHPDSVPIESNGYASMRNISIIQNMLNSIKINFSTDKWQGVTLVDNVSNVTNVTSRQKARDILSIKQDYFNLINSFASLAWIYDPAFSIAKLKETGAVTIRSGADGFIAVLSVIFSGEGLISDNTVLFDTSIAILL